MVSPALLPRTPRFRPRPLRTLAAWGSSPSKLQQAKPPLLTPTTPPRGLLAGEGAGGAAGTSCVPHPRQEGRTAGRFPRTASGLSGWSVRTGSHGLRRPTGAPGSDLVPGGEGRSPAARVHTQSGSAVFGAADAEVQVVVVQVICGDQEGRHCRCRRPAGTPSWSVRRASCSRLPGPQLCSLCPDFLLPPGSSHQPSTQLQDQPCHGATHTHTHTHTPLCCTKPSACLTITDGK